MSFFDKQKQYQRPELENILHTSTPLDVRRVLQKTSLCEKDFLMLLSPAAEPFLEEMAQKAHEMTIRQFGKTILLFTPMYLSNFCTNQCVYCGFNTCNQITRKQLTPEEVEIEAKAIADTGLKHILILTGDARNIASIDYLKSCIHILSQYFTSISIEIYALEAHEYRELIHAGVDALTIYQETYNPDLYRELHGKGPKSDYRFRLEAPERACRENIRAVNIGALLGLDAWQTEAFMTGIHAAYLQDRFPEVEVSISLPRMRPHAGEFQPRFIVKDRNLIQILLAFRLFMPRAGITISTRESETFRNNLLRLGVTKMSAGSTTRVGGHTNSEDNTGQFEICDHRTVSEMKSFLQSHGYQPVFKDWHPISGMDTTAKEHRFEQFRNPG